MNNRDNWERLSPAYQRSVQISTVDVHYGPNGLGENALRIFGTPISGKSIIDLGCGGGQNCIALAKLGAAVTGVDFSAEQLRFAQVTAIQEGVSLHLINDDIQFLSTLPAHEYDIALSCFASEYVEDLDSFISNVFRTLKPSGFFILCDLHPVASAAAANARTYEAFCFTLDYFNSGSREFEWADSLGLSFRRYHRTLADYFACFRAHGLCVTDLREPRIEPEPEPGRHPYIDPHLGTQDALWDMAPYTIVMKICRSREV